MVMITMMMVDEGDNYGIDEGVVALIAAYSYNR